MITAEAKERLMLEAMSLQSNESFQKAMEIIRSDALESLARTPATDTEAIRDLQARVYVVDEIRSAVDGHVRAGKPVNAPGLV